MFNVISYMLAHWYDGWNAFIIAINLCNVELCIDVYHKQSLGRKCLSNILYSKNHPMICLKWFLT